MCSFEGAPASDYRDLDRAGPPLLRVFELSRVDAEILATMRHALDGHEELNPEYRGHPNTILVHPVTVVAPYTVTRIAKTLAETDFRLVSAALPEDAEQARQALGDSISSLRHPFEYLAPHFDTLRDFYVEAAQRSMAAVTWWD